MIHNASLNERIEDKRTTKKSLLKTQKGLHQQLPKDEVRESKTEGQKTREGKPLLPDKIYLPLAGTKREVPIS